MALPAPDFPQDAEIRRSVGRAIRVVMTAKGITGKDLAAKLPGLSEGSLSERLSGKTSLRAEELWRLAEVLDVPVGTFFRDPKDLISTTGWYAESAGHGPLRDVSAPEGEQTEIPFTEGERTLAVIPS